MAAKADDPSATPVGWRRQKTGIELSFAHARADNADRARDQNEHQHRQERGEREIHGLGARGGDGDGENAIAARSWRPYKGTNGRASSAAVRKHDSYSRG